MTAIANDRRELFMRLFDINYCSGIFVEPTAAESVLLAVQDLRRDLCRISGQQDGFSPVSSERSAGIKNILNNKNVFTFKVYMRG